MARYSKLGALFVVALLSLILLSEETKADAEQPAIPLQSQLVDANNHKLHIHHKGKNNDSPLLILLSGPTDNWHSDSAWWLVAQNILSERYQTLVIDRAGQAWSERIEAPSYRQFADDLKVLLTNDNVIELDRKLVFVAFASSNVALSLLLDEDAIVARTQGVVLIDPDVLTPHSLEHYTGETEGYKKGWRGLEEYIRAGKYDERIGQKIKTEREHLEAIIPSKYQLHMDWDYYDAVEMIRRTRDYQVHKFLEASVYKEDLEAAKAQGLPASLPLVILDTDFEAAYLEQLEDKNIKASIAQWRQEGIEWYFALAQSSQCGAYWPVDTREHLLMMTQPELIEQAIDKVLACSKLR